MSWIELEHIEPNTTDTDNLYCISVSSPTHQFLVGENFAIPTCNTDEGKEQDALKGEAQMICGSLARLGRAAGVHLLLATQRPDAKLISGETKAVWVEHEVPTVDGFKKIGDIQPGKDLVFSPLTGRTIDISGKSEVIHEKAYEVEFSTGEKIITDARHKWPIYFTPNSIDILAATLTDREVFFRLHSSPLKTYSTIALSAIEAMISPTGQSQCESLRTLIDDGKIAPTHTLADDADYILFDGTEVFTILNDYLGRRVQADDPNVAIPMTSFDIYEWVNRHVSNDKLRLRSTMPLRFSHQPTSISPWLLGCYLGDANNDDSKYSGVDFDSVLTNDNRVPSEYLWNSVVHRSELLSGLLETGGVHNGDKTSFTHASRGLVDDVVFLARSLGLSPSAPVDKGGLWSTDLAWREVLIPTPDDRTPQHTDYIYIESIREVDSVPCQCIEVDDDSLQFVLGRSFVPTYNSNLHVRINCGRTVPIASQMILDNSEGTRVSGSVKGRIYLQVHGNGAHGQGFFQEQDWIDKWLASQGKNPDGTPLGTKQSRLAHIADMSTFEDTDLDEQTGVDNAEVIERIREEEESGVDNSDFAELNLTGSTGGSSGRPEDTFDSDLASLIEENNEALYGDDDVE